MKDKISLAESKSIELEILDYIHEKCKEHGLRYFIAYGTLLGAIRHKGFIPWDDDVDICMPRPDYEQLLKIIKKENHERFGLLEPGVNGYYNEFAKIIDARTYLDQGDCEETYNGGIWVDIFPLDGIPKNNFFFRWKLNTLYFFKALASFKKIPQRHRKLKPLLWLPWKFSRLMGWHKILQMEEKIAKSHKYEDYEFVTYVLHNSSNNVFFKREMFEDLIEVKFEDRLYLAPKDYDAYLRLSYGEDYMELPPIEKRFCHSLEAYWR